MTPHRSPAPGDRVDDRYALLDRLGEGTFGDVWRARDTRLADRLVTVKFLKADFLDHAEIVARFEHEADALALLSHPNVVAVLDRGGWSGLRYIVMEYVDGPTLAAWLAAHATTGRPPDPGAVRDLFGGICRGVAAAHAVRAPGPVVHRDLKPANVMLRALPTGEWTAKVLDFGIARLGEREHTRSGALLGTLEYMAPEQGLGQADGVGPWSDVFSLAVILTEMLTGLSRPSRTEPWWIVAMTRGDAIRERLDALDPTVPGAVWEVVGRALRSDPRERPSDAGALLVDLQRAWRAADAPHPPGEVAREPVSAAPARLANDALAATALAPPPTAARPRPQTYAFVVAGMIALGLGVAGTTLLVRAPTEQAPTSTPAAAPAPASWRCPDRMVVVPGGRFTMGSGDGEGEADERPAHVVRLAPYCLDRTEVTVRDYAACVAARACRPANTVDGARMSAGTRQTLSEYCNGPRGDRRDHPINCVDWSMAQEHCRWRGARLPTEAEWEFAARGADGRRFPWGNADPTSQLCWSGALRRTESCPVGAQPGGASPFGALDMAGGVYEWTADRFGPYAPTAEPAVDPAGPSVGTSRVYRGGSWRSDVASFVRSASRVSVSPEARSYVVGFRCAVNAPAAASAP